MCRFAMDRHNRAIHMSFMDGSMRKVGLYELWTLKWHRDAAAELRRRDSLAAPLSYRGMGFQPMQHRRACPHAGGGRRCHKTARGCPCHYLVPSGGIVLDRSHIWRVPLIGADVDPLALGPEDAVAVELGRVEAAARVDGRGAGQQMQVEAGGIDKESGRILDSQVVLLPHARGIAEGRWPDCCGPRS